MISVAIYLFIYLLYFFYVLISFHKFNAVSLIGIYSLKILFDDKWMGNLIIV